MISIHVNADVPDGWESGGYYPHDEERIVHRGGRENEALGASYDRYTRNWVLINMLVCSIIVSMLT